MGCPTGRQVRERPNDAVSGTGRRKKAIALRWGVNMEGKWRLTTENDEEVMEGNWKAKKRER